MPITVSKSKFKPHALSYFREVQETGEEIIITDHNTPVARIVSYQPSPSKLLEELRGAVRRYEDPFEPVCLDDWEMLK